MRKVMDDGYSTSGGLGAGMPGVRRLMDEFKVDTELGVGNNNHYNKMATMKEVTMDAR